MITGFCTSWSFVFFVRKSIIIQILASAVRKKTNIYSNVWLRARLRCSTGVNQSHLKGTTEFFPFSAVAYQTVLSKWTKVFGPHVSPYRSYFCLPPLISLLLVVFETPCFGAAGLFLAECDVTVGASVTAVNATKTKVTHQSICTSTRKINQRSSAVLHFLWHFPPRRFHSVRRPTSHLQQVLLLF